MFVELNFFWKNTLAVFTKFVDIVVVFKRVQLDENQVLD